MFYEYHKFADADLKIIYHLDRLRNDGIFPAHLHQNVELILMNEGEAEIIVDHEVAEVSVGEMVVIAPNRLHRIRSVSEECSYHCLIIDHNMYEDWFTESEIKFPLKTNDAQITSVYLRITGSARENKPCHKQETTALIMLMMSLLFRKAAGSEESVPPAADSKRLDMVRKAITYMYQHFSEDISIDDICNVVGFSKYYFCRTFKEVTGQTPLWHLNYIRCQSARSLLRSGKITITRCAASCGFNNASYFCKIYKRYFGNQPKEDCHSHK